MPVVLFALLLAGPGLRAQDSTDCSDCTKTTVLYAAAHADQTKCPGNNAVVCDFTYNKVTKAECTKNGTQLRDCKPKEVDMTYSATGYAATTCGTDNGVYWGCPAGNGAAMNITRKGWICEGRPWLEVLPVVLAEAYTLSVTTQNGPTALSPSAATRLGSTVVSIPAGALRQALAEGLLASDGERAFLTLNLDLEQPTRFRFPPQTHSPAVLTDGLEVLSATAGGQQARVDLSLPVANLGAFADYSIDLANLRIAGGRPPAIGERPSSSSGTAVATPETLTVLLRLSSGDSALISGAGTIGRVGPATCLVSPAVPFGRN